MVDPCDSTPLGFGRHKEKTFLEVLKSEKGYVSFCKNVIAPSGPMAAFVEYIKRKEGSSNSTTTDNPNPEQISSLNTTSTPAALYVGNPYEKASSQIRFTQDPSSVPPEERWRITETVMPELFGHQNVGVASDRQRHDGIGKSFTAMHVGSHEVAMARNSEKMATSTATASLKKQQFTSSSSSTAQAQVTAPFNDGTTLCLS